MTDSLDEMALDYHRLPRPGKIQIAPTKPLANQRDLALAYTPGVAAASLLIAENPAEAATLTSRSNMVAVVTNGTAVLGLGDIGPLAAKPVMEGKAVLFKKFAGIDAFDIELDVKDPEKICEIVAALEPTFGAVNLEDIKAPECFQVERRLRDAMKIPVFHDDQHGTAIVAGAAIRNALRINGKNIADVKLVSTGGGAAGIACLNLLRDMGLKRENVWLCDHRGLVHEGRTEDITPQKMAYARKSDLRDLEQVIDNADIFLGLSAPDILTASMVKRMAAQPIILALANPMPEILPNVVHEVRDDAIIATGRSDFPNQVNNVLCFPFIFRGALDVGATEINEAMKVACTEAIADLAMQESSEVVANAYRGENLTFGAEYLIPKPFDPRLISVIAPAVAKAAMDSGVATRPIEDIEIYREKLSRFVFRSGMLMKPVFERARGRPKRLVFAEGEEERVLRAAQVLMDEGVCKPILIGRPDALMKKVMRLGLRMRPGHDVELCDPEDDPRFEDYWTAYHRIMERKGVSPDIAKTVVRTNNTVIGAIMLHRGETDAMICGTQGQYDLHLNHVIDVVGIRGGVQEVSALSVLVMPKGTVFLADTHVTPEPTPEQIAETAIMAADEMKRFGVVPRVALVSHSNFGNSNTASAKKMREAYNILANIAPDLDVEGEMRANVALNPELRRRIFTNARFNDRANLLVFPNLDAANSAFNLLVELGDGLPVGPILVGPAKPAHVLSPAVSTRGIVNMGALAVVDAQLQDATA